MHVGLRAAIYGTLSISVGRALPGREFSRWCMKNWCIGAAGGLKMRRELFNGHLLEPSRQVVFVSNHLSLLDILLLGSYLGDIDYRWLSKDAIFRVPFLGWHLKSAGHIPVFRGEKKKLNRSLPDRIHDVIEEGASLLFFPEGTRSADGELKPFKMGAFRTAIDEDIPVQPLVIRGTGRLMEKGAIDITLDPEREASVTVLPPIAPSRAIEDPAERAEALRDTAFDAFQEELGDWRE